MIITMDVPTRTIIYINDNCPGWLFPYVAFVLGVMHLFPLCCVTSFVLAEIGIVLNRMFPSCDFAEFNVLESDYYDEGLRMHMCRFHAVQTENFQSYDFTSRPWYWKITGLRPAD